MFVKSHFSGHDLIDFKAIQRNIELTRFPAPNDLEHQDTINYPGLVRAADLIGQLSDPVICKKCQRCFMNLNKLGPIKL